MRQGQIYLSGLNEQAMNYQNSQFSKNEVHIHTQAQPFKHTIYFQYVTKETVLCAKHHIQVHDSILY